MLKSDNSAPANSQRLAAARLERAQFTPNCIAKKIGLRAPKHVETTRNSETKKATRGRSDREIVSMYAETVRAERVFWSDES